MKRISVIVLSFNKLSLLYQAMDSVLGQDYGNIELIVSDDGSEFFNVESIRDYCSTRKTDAIEVKILKNPKNVGTVKNLNRALAHASGYFLMPLAGDDVLYDSKVLSQIVHGFESIPENALIMSTQVGIYDIELKNLKENTLKPKQISLLASGVPNELYAALCFNCFLPSGGTIYRREFFDLYGKYDEQYHLVEDWPLFLRIVRSGIKIHHADILSVKHRDGGVSKEKPQVQRQYQTDLINVIKNEILPNLIFVPQRLRGKVLTLCQDKLIIFHLRFELVDVCSIKKLVWILANPSSIFALYRGLKRKLRTILK